MVTHRDGGAAVHRVLPVILGALPALPLGATVAIAGVFGLVIGSFLNVVAYRTPRGLSVNRPPSFCPSCGTPVRPLDNVPLVSWVILRGRCRSCRAPISVRYPVVEAGTGALFAVVAAVAGSHWAVPGLCLLLATSGVLAVIEVDGLQPPSGPAVVGTLLGAAALVLAGAADRSWAHVVGLAVGGGAGLVLSVVVFRLDVRQGSHDVGAPVTREARVAGARWALLPAAAVIGWCGGSAPLSAAVGAGLGVVATVALAGATTTAARRYAGPAVVWALAALVAFVTAAAAGGVPGR